MESNTGSTLYMKDAQVGDVPSVDMLSLSMYCYLKYTRTPFKVKYTSTAPYVAILERNYKVDQSESFEQFRGVVKDLDQDVRQHNQFQVFKRNLTPHLQRLELAQLHYLYQKFPTFDWALERFTNIKERLDQLNLGEEEIEVMGSGACQQISSILGDNVTLFRILINERQWPGQLEEDITVVEKWENNFVNMYWDFNPCTSLDVTLTRILWVIKELVDTSIYHQFIKYPNLVAYVERFNTKFVKTQDAVDLSSRSDSYDFVEGLINQSDPIGDGSYGSVYSCQFPQGNPLDLPAGTYAVKALKNVDDWAYGMEKLFLREFQYDFAPQLFGYGLDGVRKYFIMEYLSGGTLTGKIGDLEYGEALDIIIDVCDGIHAIHTHWSKGRLLHDDLAPRNILLTQDGRAKIIDFGSVSVYGHTEQLKGSIYRERTIDEHKGPIPVTKVATQSRDVFSLGILIIELFTVVDVAVNKDAADVLQQEIDRVPTLSLIRENIRNSGCDDRKAQAILDLARSCIRKERSEYPKAYEVSFTLRNIRD